MEMGILPSVGDWQTFKVHRKVWDALKKTDVNSENRQF
jgi:hypothetical protein